MQRDGIGSRSSNRQLHISLNLGTSRSSCNESCAGAEDYWHDAHERENEEIAGPSEYRNRKNLVVAALRSPGNQDAGGYQRAKCTVPLFSSGSRCLSTCGIMQVLHL
jgi:hypothetical protein